MRAIRRISPPLLVFLLLSLARVSATEPMGSISIRMTYEHQPIPGGSITLYQAARLVDGRYVPAPEFAERTDNLEGALSPEDAQILAEYAAENQLPGQTQKLDDDGFARFSPLEPGLYLLVQEEAATGFLPVNPFLVAMPRQVEGELCYHVDAGPKCAPAPLTPDPPGIPQTGLLRWPVALMTVFGLFLIAGGLLLYRRDSHA